ncbi:hypothetical protein, partial [Streptomyces sp. NPDC059538]|uniref:hypothetical protein n=1 Tax=Streptomyces sp. NPDC059538 TaxID=3346860 RepID=UPI00369160D6
MTTIRSSAVPWWPQLRLREPVTAPRARLLVFPHSGAGPNTLFPVVESRGGGAEGGGVAGAPGGGRGGGPPGRPRGPRAGAHSHDTL